MSSYNKLLLGKANDFTSAHINYANYTKPSGTFDATETSMYAEVVGLASSTYYGGASLANQSERYLIAMTDFDASTGNYNPYIHSRNPNNDGTGSVSFEGLFSGTFSGYSPINSTTFSGIQTDLENDGKHFFASTHSTNQETQYLLIVDKNSLGSGSSSSSGTSLTSWAYSSQSATDPNILIDWSTPTPDYSITADSTDIKADIKAKVTAHGSNIDTLMLDYFLDHYIDQRQKNTQVTSLNNFIEYINKKINTQ